MTQAAILKKLLFSESKNEPSNSDKNPAPDYVNNIEQFSNNYRKYVVQEMTEELDKQDREAEQIQRTRSDPAEA